MRLIAISLLLVLAAPVFSQSDTATVTKSSKYNVRWIAKERRVENPSVLILEMKDAEGKGAKGTSINSGKRIQTEFKNRMLAKGIKTIPAETFDLNEGFEKAKMLNLDYVMKAIIVEWVDENTAWNGKVDVVEVTIDLYSAEGEIIATATHNESTSKAEWKSTPPDKFFPIITNNLIRLLFFNTDDISKTKTK